MLFEKSYNEKEKKHIKMRNLVIFARVIDINYIF